MDALLCLAEVTVSPGVLGGLLAAVAGLGAALYKTVDVFLGKKDAEGDGWKAQIGKIHTYVKQNHERHNPILTGDMEVYSWKLSGELKKAMERTPELLEQFLELQEEVLDELRTQRQIQESFNRFLREELEEARVDD